jgi:hypothetical protein
VFVLGLVTQGFVGAAGVSMDCEGVFCCSHLRFGVSALLSVCSIVITIAVCLVITIEGCCVAPKQHLA